VLNQWCKCGEGVILFVINWYSVTHFSVDQKLISDEKSEEVIGLLFAGESDLHAAEFNDDA